MYHVRIDALQPLTHNTVIKIKCLLYNRRVSPKFKICDTNTERPQCARRGPCNESWALLPRCLSLRATSKTESGTFPSCGPTLFNCGPLLLHQEDPCFPLRCPDVLLCSAWQHEGVKECLSAVRDVLLLSGGKHNVLPMNVHINTASTWLNDCSIYAAHLCVCFYRL